MNRLLLPLLAIFFTLLSCQSDEKPVTGETVNHTKSVEMNVPDSLLRHAVLFSFKESSHPTGVKEVEDAFKALPAAIPEIHSFEWGTNNSPEGLDQGFTHLFFVTFKSEADREVYLPHPAHKAFVEILKPHLEEVLVLDYWAQP